MTHAKKTKAGLCDARSRAHFVLYFRFRRRGGEATGGEVGDHSPFAVRQLLKFNVRDVVTREVVGFAVDG